MLELSSAKCQYRKVLLEVMVKDWDKQGCAEIFSILHRLRDLDYDAFYAGRIASSKMGDSDQRAPYGTGDPRE
jgi:hypothetical protein